MKSETRNTSAGSVQACRNCTKKFVIDEDNINFCEKVKVPLPTWCPECRMMRRLAWMGTRILYKRKLDGEEVITFYPPDTPFKLYKQDYWWSDKWDPKSYGRDYDFSKSFFEQFYGLFKAVPHPVLFTSYATMKDSPYCNAASDLKNCYLAFKSDSSENCAYTTVMSRMKDCLDLAFSNDSELCYEIVTVNKGYQVFYSQDSDDCHDVWFSRDLVGCSDCVGCINLRNKQYYIFNQPYSREEYKRKLVEFDFGSAKNVQEFKKKAEEFFLSQPRKQFHGRKNSDVSGDYIFNSKNVHDSYMMRNCENIKYSQFLKTGPVKDAYDYTQFGVKAELMYDTTWIGLDCYNVKFGVWNYTVHDLEYSFGCHGSGNLFGCVGVRSSEYCVLNKQYSKIEYQDLVARIKKQMLEVPYRDRLGREYRYGEHLPVDFCPWAYSETMVYEFFPITKVEAIKKGYQWRDPDQREYGPATVSVPDNIKEASDEILKGVLKCEDCGRNYQLIKMELQFLRRFVLPVPRRCPLCRERSRIKQLNPLTTYSRKCAKCGKDIQASYAPERPEIVYCEECYNVAVA